MKTKLTLRLDEELIRQAKTYAKNSGKSVSRLVAEYFSLLRTKPESERELTPAVRSLVGAVKTRRIGLPE